MDNSSDNSEPRVVARRSKRKKTALSTSSSSSSSGLDERQERILRRRRKRRKREETIESSSDSDHATMSRMLPETDTGSSSFSTSPMSNDDFDVGRPRTRLRRVVAQLRNEDSDSDGHEGASSSQMRRFPSRRSLLNGRPRVQTSARTVASRRLEMAAEQDVLVAAVPQQTAAAQVAVAGPAGDLSDSGGEEGGEKCAVCLRRIRQQELGSPECCDHTFCLDCLVTWSKSCNQCPLDRRPFKLILVRDNVQGPVTRQVAVEERAQPVVFEEEDLFFCLICGEFDREDMMLLCDGCDRGFHIDCLTPPLPAVPEVDEWFCPTCEAWQQVTVEVVARADQNMPNERLLRARRPIRGASFENAGIRSMFNITNRAAQRLDAILNAFNVQVRSPSPPVGIRISAEAGPSTSGTQPTRRPRNKVVKKKTRKVKRRKTVKRRYVTKKKKIFVENDDGTVTEEIISVMTKVTRRRKRKITKKRKKVGRAAGSRGSRNCGTSNSTRDRLERALGGVASEATSRRRASPAVASNLSRFSPGIPTLNLFEPRHELAPVSSGSDEEMGGGETGLLSRGRGARPRPIERSKAIELLRTAPSRRRVIPQAYEGPSDLLSSILESQAIWHSKSSEVTVRRDGTVEPSPSNRVDVRSARPERVATAAPIFPGAGSVPYRPAGGTSTSPGSSQSRPTAPPSASAGSSETSSRSAPVNDREGYSNFLNNLSLGPAPLCRGGPPLRIRMPVRPQLRRIPLVPRRTSRALYDEEDDVEEPEEKIEDGEEENGAEQKPQDDTDAGVKQSEQEVDLYSDIEPMAERDGSESESTAQFSALGPPPEPPAFLLNLATGEDKTNDKKDSDVYDPAEPCDSEDEMVIDETPAAVAAAPVVLPLPPPPEPPAVLNDALADSVDSSENSNLCPVLQLYSTASVSLLQKNENPQKEDLNSDKGDGSESAQIIASVPVSPLQKEKSPTRENNLAAKPDVTPYAAKDRSPSKGSSRSPSSSPSRKSRHSSSPSPRRTRKDSTRSQNSQSPASFTTRRRQRRSLENNENESSDDNDASPRLSARESTKQISNQIDKEVSANGEHPRVSTGLEGLEVEEVSSDMEENEFSRLSSLSLSGISDRSRSSSPIRKKKKKKKRTKIKNKSKKTASEEGEIESDREKPKSKKDEKTSEPDKKGMNARRSSKPRSPGRKVLSSQENKEDKEGWKKVPKKSRNYRGSRKTSKERGLSSEKKRGRSTSPKRDKKKSKDRKKSDKKKEIERYDVRKVVKEKEHVRKDEFGRDLPEISVSRSRSKSRSRSRGRGRPRSPVRHTSHSPVRRAIRVSLSPSRRRRRRRSVSRSPLSPRRNRRARRSPDRDGRKGSRSRGRRSLSGSPSPRRNRLGRNRKSHSRSASLSPAPRARDAYSPVRVIRRSISPVAVRSYVKAWSPNVTREKSLENLTVVLKSKDKKKRKKKKDERRELKSVENKKKKGGNSKEVFASGDNVLVSVNFSSKSNKSDVIVLPDLPVREVSSKKKKKRMAMDDNSRPSKKNKMSNTVTKSAVASALSSDGQAKRKKQGRLTGEDAEEILNRKPVAVIDLDMSPYREQTPSPINVVVVSDSGSGDEEKGTGKAQQRPRSPEITVLPAPPVITTSGPKTPPEPPLKFSIAKAPLIRSIANPLAEADDETEELVAEDGSQAAESVEVAHKGPNTPPEPRGPSTPPRGPSTPPMEGPNTPQSSPDAYDPFEPTKSRSPSPTGLAVDVSADKSTVVEASSLIGPAGIVPSEDAPKHTEPNETISQETPIVNNVTDATLAKETSPIQVVEVIASANFNKTTSVRRSTPQPMTPNAATTLQAFSLPSPKTPNRTNAVVPVSGIHRLQHRLGSPVSKTPNSVKSTPEKRSNDTLLPPRSKRNGPVQDGSHETVDMDDSPYSPGSSEGDDLFDPPPAAPLPPPAPTPQKPTKTKATPVKAVAKFESLFGSSGPNISPLKNGGKKPGRVPKTALPKVASDKKPAKPPAGPLAKKGTASKMDEDQLRILDEVPSSAVELQVKDKYLKKLNRQERVVDEVKTVLKPHYAKKHVSKEEYKQILRRAVPKICHSKSGEINPSKIHQLVEAYVRKYRQNKKKGAGGVQKPAKLMKSGMFS